MFAKRSRETRLSDNTIVVDSFSPFGELQPLPSRPDLTTEQRAAREAADRITYPDVVHECFADDTSAYALARDTFGFPEPVTGPVSDWGKLRPAKFSRVAIREWRASLDRLNAALTK